MRLSSDKNIVSDYHSVGTYGYDQINSILPISDSYILLSGYARNRLGQGENYFEILGMQVPPQILTSLPSHFNTSSSFQFSVATGPWSYTNSDLIIKDLDEEVSTPWLDINLSKDGTVHFSGIAPSQESSNLIEFTLENDDQSLLFQHTLNFLDSGANYPTIELIDELIIEQSETISLDLLLYDADNDKISLEYFGPSWVTVTMINANLAEVVLAPSENEYGTHQLLFRSIDDSGLATEKQLMVEVQSDSSSITGNDSNSMSLANLLQANRLNYSYKSVMPAKQFEEVTNYLVNEVDSNILVVETENKEIGSIDETTVSADNGIKTEESVIIIKDDTDDESKENLHVSASEPINLISKSNSVSNLGNSEPVESENTVDETAPTPILDENEISHLETNESSIIQSIALMEGDSNILVVETENNKIGSIGETTVSADKGIKTEESVIIIKDDTDDESKEDLHVSASEPINLISKSNSVSNLGNSEPVESENTVDEKVPPPILAENETSHLETNESSIIQSIALKEANNDDSLNVQILTGTDSSVSSETSKNRTSLQYSMSGEYLGENDYTTDHESPITRDSKMLAESHGSVEESNSSSLLNVRDCFLGSMIGTQTNWYYNSNLGWLFIPNYSEHDESFWLWSNTWGWLWISKDVWNENQYNGFVFSSVKSNWLYLKIIDQASTTVAFDYTTLMWQKFNY